MTPGEHQLHVEASGCVPKHILRKFSAAGFLSNFRQVTVFETARFRKERAGQHSVEKQKRKRTENRCKEAFGADGVNRGVSPEEQHCSASHHAPANAHQHCCHGATGISAGHDGLCGESGERTESDPAEQFIQARADDFRLELSTLATKTMTRGQHHQWSAWPAMNLSFNFSQLLSSHRQIDRFQSSCADSGRYSLAGFPVGRSTFTPVRLSFGRFCRCSGHATNGRFTADARIPWHPDAGDEADKYFCILRPGF
jgi:hypothetical protein